MISAYRLLFFFLSILGCFVLSCSENKLDFSEKRNSNWIEFIKKLDTTFIDINEADRFIFDTQFTGEIIGYFDSAKVQFIEHYKNGFPYGESSRFYRNGVERLRTSYYANKKDGEFVCTYDNGRLCSEFGIIDGQINDTAVVYSYNGDSLHKVYMKGEKVELLEEYNLPNDFEYEKYMECMK